MVSFRERCTRKCTSPRVLSRSDFEQHRARRRKNGTVILRRTFENACTRASRVRTPGNTWRDPGDCSFAHPPTLPRLMCSKFLSLPLYRPPAHSPSLHLSLSLFYDSAGARHASCRASSSIIASPLCGQSTQWERFLFPPHLRSVTPTRFCLFSFAKLCGNSGFLSACHAGWSTLCFRLSEVFLLHSRKLIMLG